MKKSLVIKHSIVIAGHKTSVAVEDAFWKGLKEIAEQRHKTLSHLIASIDDSRQHA
jgi:predicted DNA-binding ribbon-helix-helix protein